MYLHSIDQGKTWVKISRGAARKRMSHVAMRSELDGLFEQIDEGRIFDMGGWGWVKRKDGRWNSKATMTSKQLHFMARYLIAQLVQYPDSTLTSLIPIAMNKKDRDALLKVLKKMGTMECKAVTKTVAWSEVEKVYRKLISYSPASTRP